QAVAAYEEAADGYEAFARMSPKDSEAPDALADAVILRLALGQMAEARRDGDFFLKTYGSTRRAPAARVSFAIEQQLVERGDQAAAKKGLAAWLGAFDRSGPLDLRIDAHTSLGRVYARTGDRKKAEAEYALVRDLW